MSGSSGPIIGAPNLRLIDSITQFVNGTQAVWNNISIPIPSGVVVYAVDTTVVKMGDGVTLYAALPVLFTINSIITLSQEISAFLENENNNTGGGTGGGSSVTLDQVQNYVTNILSTYITQGQLTTDLSGYVTTPAIVTALSNLLVSPVFTGNPTAPTQAQTINDTTLATTAFVHTAINTILSGTGTGTGNGITTAQLESYVTTALQTFSTFTCFFRKSTSTNTTFEFK